MANESFIRFDSDKHRIIAPLHQTTFIRQGGTQEIVAVVNNTRYDKVKPGSIEAITFEDMKSALS